MSGDNFTDGSRKARPVLADVSNKPGKREFLFMSGNSGAKSGDRFAKSVDGAKENVEGSCKARPVLANVVNKAGKRELSFISGDSGAKSVESAKENIEFAKKVCSRVENLVKELCKNKCGVDSSEQGTAEARPENNASVVGNVYDKIDKTGDLGVNVAHTGVELGQAAKASCVSSVSQPTCSKKGSDEGVQQVSDVCSDEGVGVGRLVTRKCGFEWSILPKSHGSRFELERCVGLKGDGCVNLDAGADLLKDCSCSFCSKAAYIWADLHYQDIKGRIAALKKSQKEAGFLVQKCVKGKETDIPGRGNSEKSAKLESDLMSQWRSLFLHMEDIFVRESNQLQSSFVTLKDLRENCKMDLENMNGMPSEKQ